MRPHARCPKATSERRADDGIVARVSRRHRTTRVYLGLGAICVAALAPRSMAKADPLAGVGGEALDLTADKLEVDVPAGTAVLTGHVTLIRGNLRVDCPRIDVRYDEAPRVTWAKGSGGVTADIRGVHAEAPEVELDFGEAHPRAARRRSVDPRTGVAQRRQSDHRDLVSESDTQRRERLAPGGLAQAMTGATTVGPRGEETPASTGKLEAEGLVVALSGAEVVRGISLSLSSHEVVGVLGPSGAGKTTLFRALVGEVPLRSGRIRLDGHDVSSEPLWRRARRGLGYLPQTPSVLWDLSVEDNLATFEELCPGPPRGPLGWAEQVELEGRLSLRAGDLSGGERRRLELARALIARPKVLVCDEPFAGIDPAGADAFGRPAATTGPRRDGGHSRRPSCGRGPSGLRPSYAFGRWQNRSFGPPRRISASTLSSSDDI